MTAALSRLPPFSAQEVMLLSADKTAALSLFAFNC